MKKILFFCFLMHIFANFGSHSTGHTAHNRTKRSNTTHHSGGSHSTHSGGHASGGIINPAVVAVATSPINPVVPVQNVGLSQNPGVLPQVQIGQTQIVPPQAVQQVVMTLDMPKAQRLIADIKTLEGNLKILSNEVQAIVKANFDVTPEPVHSHHNNSNAPLPANSQQSLYSYQKRKGDSPFDPCKQLINVAGGYIPGVAVNPDNINPYTGNIITLEDLPMLQAVRSYLKRLVYLELCFLGLDDACAYDAAHLRTTPQTAGLAAHRSPTTKLAYNFNLFRPLWSFAMDFIASYDFLKNASMTISQMNNKIKMTQQRAYHNVESQTERAISSMY